MADMIKRSLTIALALQALPTPRGLSRDGDAGVRRGFPASTGPALKLRIDLGRSKLSVEP
jgi:hypothetical protein